MASKSAIPAGTLDSDHIAKAAQAEVAPFFRARIFSLDHATTTGEQELTALQLSLSKRLTDWLVTPQPEGAQGYIFFKSLPRWELQGPRKTGPSAGLVPAHISLSLATGGATEDEFLVVHFLRLQQQPGGLLERYAVQVADEDGDFLLIEAADHLPQWIEPENADGRVWLMATRLVLVSPYSVSEDFEEGAISSSQRSGPIRNLSLSIEHLRPLIHQAAEDPQLQDAAFARIDTYPSTEWMQRTQHKTTVVLPSETAAIAFSHDPQLVARAGQAFLGRDSHDMRVATKMPVFGAPQAASASQIVTGSAPVAIAVQLSRRLYTHLLSARFHPPKVFPAPYHDKISAFWRGVDSLTTAELPESQQSAEGDAARAAALEDGRRWDLGCKLAVGLEIALSIDRERRRRSKKTRQELFSVDSGPHRDSPHSAERRQSPEYGPLMSKLTKLGWFEGEVRGSKRWQELEKVAMKEWSERPSAVSQSEAQKSDSRDDLHETSWVDMITPNNVTTTGQQLRMLDPYNQVALRAQEEPDTWLYDASDSFLDGGGGDLDEQEAERKLNDFAQHVEKFVQGKGDVEGAVIDESDAGSEPDEGSESGMDVDEDAAVASAKDRVTSLTAQEKEHRLHEVLPQLASRQEWEPNANAAQLSQDLEGLREQSLEKPMVVGSSDQEERSTQGGNIPLSSDELQESFRASAKAMRSSHLAAGEYEGAESWQLDEEDDENQEDAERRGLGEDGEPETREVRRRRAEALEIDPSDSESDDEDEPRSAAAAREEDEQDEMKEFVEFARQQLGLSPDQLDKVLKDRKQSGRWVPGDSSSVQQRGPSQDLPPTPSSVKSSEDQQAPQFGQGFGKGFLNGRTLSASTGTSNVRHTPETPASSKSPPKKTVAFAQDTKASPTVSAEASMASASTGQDAGANANLSSFENLMAAMDARLNEHRASKGLPPLDPKSLQEGDVRGEDWALRRPGGASLGSVMLEQQEQERKRGSEPQTQQASTATAKENEQRSTADNAMDEDEEDNEPLSARDPELLERLLAQQVPERPDMKATLERLSKEREERAREAQLQQTNGQREAIDERMRLENGLEPPRPAERSAHGSAQITVIDDEGVDAQKSTAQSDVPPPMPRLEDDDDDDDDSDEDDEEMFPTLAAEGGQREEEAMANLIESWKAQGGQPGPVSNLMKSLGVQGQAPR